MKRNILVATFVAIVIGAGARLLAAAAVRRASEIVLYGNLDLRQVDLPFQRHRAHRRRARAGGRSCQARARCSRASTRAGSSRRSRKRGRRSRRSKPSSIGCVHGSRPEEIAQARAAARLRQSRCRECAAPGEAVPQPQRDARRPRRDASKTSTTRMPRSTSRMPNS